MRRSALWAALVVQAWAASAHAQVPLPEELQHARQVTFSAGGHTLREVLGELKSQSELEFFMGQDAALDRTVRVGTGPKALWDSVMEVAEQADLPPGQGWQIKRPLTDSFQQVGGRPSVAGSVLVMARRVRHEVDLRRPEAAADRFSIDVRLYGDGSVWMLHTVEQVSASLARDGDGHSLAPAQRVAEGTNLLRDQHWGESEIVHILLERPKGVPRVGDMLSRVEGTIPVALASKTDRVTLKGAGEIKKKYGDLDATFSWKVSSNNRIALQAAFARPASMSDEAWNEWDKRLAVTRMWMHDSEGKRIGTTSTGSSWGAKQRSQSVFYTQKDGAPPGPGILSEAVFEVAEEAKVVPVPYQFENLLLP